MANAEGQCSGFLTIAAEREKVGKDGAGVNLWRRVKFVGALRGCPKSVKSGYWFSSAGVQVSSCSLLLPHLP